MPPRRDFSESSPQPPALFDGDRAFSAGAERFFRDRSVGAMGANFGDLDNDGDEDVYANVGDAVPGNEYNKALFENPGHAND